MICLFKVHHTWAHLFISPHLIFIPSSSHLHLISSSKKKKSRSIKLFFHSKKSKLGSVSSHLFFLSDAHTPHCLLPQLISSHLISFHLLLVLSVILRSSSSKRSYIQGIIPEKAGGVAVPKSMRVALIQWSKHFFLLDAGYIYKHTNPHFNKNTNMHACFALL